MAVAAFLARYFLLMKRNSENNQRETMNFEEILHNMLKSRMGKPKEDVL